MLPLVVQHLRKSYGLFEAVRGVSFRAEPGEIFGLLGPNGAGKTTTLECVLGLRRADAGQISLGEIDLMRHSAAAKSVIGAALQSAQLQDKITPREALKLFGAFYPRSRSAEVMLEEFQLDEKADAPFASLSGGQKQRLFLALAFVHDPKLVVLDEPTVGLDPTARRELHDVIRRARASGCTLVLSTHDLAEAEQLCDRLAIIDRGRIVAADTVSRLIASAQARPRVCVRVREFNKAEPIKAIDLACWNDVDGAIAVTQRGSEIVIATDHVNRTTVSVVQRLQKCGEEVLDLRVQYPSLEDVFFERTGRTYSETSDSNIAAQEVVVQPNSATKDLASSDIDGKGLAEDKREGAKIKDDHGKSGHISRTGSTAGAASPGSAGGPPASEILPVESRTPPNPGDQK